MRRAEQRGVALVITLILLSVITVIAVAFLAVTQRERISVAHRSHYVDTRLMLDSALERVRGEIVADILARSNLLGPDFMVSVNVDGADRAAYDQATIANLQFDPRAPVFINTNRSGPPSNDFRFWLDLNRNGWFEETGRRPVTNAFGQVELDDQGVIRTNYQNGDPQWIGVLADPSQPHSRENRFVGRYAYLVVPAGRALDLNFIHNNAQQFQRTPAGFVPNWYFRNQGFGSWEINLASFLADLNTNVWNPVGFEYRYNPPLPSDPLPLPVPGVNFFQSGAGFSDASALLRYRYGFNIANLVPVANLVPAVAPGFAGDFIDGYANDPLPADPAAVDNDVPVQPWAGSDSTNHFFSLHELWATDPQRGYGDFVSRLRHASATNLSTYDRTTFYRLLSQLGTDSVPEERNPFRRRFHLNYKGYGSHPTNYVPWTAADSLDFFTNTAFRLLGEEFGWTNGIPVYTNGTASFAGQPLYSPRVHQLLQIAANITDARRTNFLNWEMPAFYPSVFQPRFELRGDDLYIVGFKNVNDTNRNESVSAGFKSRLENGQMLWFEVEDPVVRRRFGGAGGGRLPEHVNFYGVPLIVGAKKGFPNFNEFAMQTVVQVSRKLEFRKNAVSDVTPNETNQMFMLGVSNVFGLEAWNSYSNAYPRRLQILYSFSSTTLLTNNGGVREERKFFTNNFRQPVDLAEFQWSGQGSSNHFQVPPVNVQIALPDSVYYVLPSPHFETAGYTNRFERNLGLYTNQWGLTVSNRLIFFLYDMSDKNPPQIVDAAALSGMNTFLNVSRELTETQPGRNLAMDRVWSVRPFRDIPGNVPDGVKFQLDISLGNAQVSDADWQSYGGLDPAVGQDRRKAIDGFRHFMDREKLSLLWYTTNDLPPLGTVHNAPFVPIKKIYQTTSWQVNDPLVHYLASDLVDDAQTKSRIESPGLLVPVSLTNNYNLGRLNERYRPWGGNPNTATTASRDATDVLPAARDPGVRSSDDWDFPEGPFPNVGWLGRVHRGTPWQTLYLKSAGIRPDFWKEAVGSSFFALSNALPTAPTNDWRLVDWFTVAPHPNATRGTLSVNQQGLAAWSAVLSGIPVTRVADTNSDGTLDVEEVLTAPAAIEPPVKEIVDGINRQRGKMRQRRFERVGEILSTPELTDQSPYLNAPNANRDDALTDAAYERIPQAILSLLKAGAGEGRFVVYTFGQSLQPAPSSILNSGPNFGLCTNYQITGESAARAVVRVDFDPMPDPKDPGVWQPDPERPHAVIEQYNLLPVE